MDASALSTSIRDGGLSSLIPSSMRFDRVDVSNILDTEYVGIPGVLGNWGPLLKPASDAAIVGHFMNWVPKQPGSSASNSAQEVLGPLTNKMTDLGRVGVLLNAQRCLNLRSSRSLCQQRAIPRCSEVSRYVRLYYHFFDIAFCRPHGNDVGSTIKHYVGLG
jgi:hypothetical protein